MSNISACINYSFVLLLRTVHSVHLPIFNYFLCTFAVYLFLFFEIFVCLDRNLVCVEYLEGFSPILWDVS
jgi:hypothetical protein